MDGKSDLDLENKINQDHQCEEKRRGTRPDVRPDRFKRTNWTMLFFRTNPRYQTCGSSGSNGSLTFIRLELLTLQKGT